MYKVDELYKTITADNFFLEALDMYSKALLDKGVGKVKSDESKGTIELLKRGACTCNQELLKIDNYAAIAIGLYIYGQEEYRFTEGNNFSKYFKYCLQLAKLIKPSSYDREYEELKSWLLSVGIVRFYKQGSNSFKKFVERLADAETERPRSKKTLYRFTDAFGKVLPELNISTKDLFNVTERLLSLTQSDADINTNQHQLLEGLRRMAIENTDAAVSLFHYSINKGGTAPRITSALSAGLYDAIGKQFILEAAKDYWKHTGSAEPLLLGLSVVSNNTLEDTLLFLNLYDKLGHEPSLGIALSRMLLGLLKSWSNREDNTLIATECFSRLEQLIANQDKDFARSIIRQVSFIDGYGSFKTRLLLKVVDQPYFTVTDFIKAVEQVYWYLHECSSLKKVLSAIAKKEPFQDIGKHFVGSLNQFDKKEVDLMIIELITDNRGYLRELGNSLFSANGRHQLYTFDFDILSLPALSQYKLWMGLCQNPGEPKNYLVALLPLLNSPSETVRESFIGKLEQLTEDYAGHITEVLERYMYLHNKPEVVGRVAEYLDTFYKTFADIKKGIHELDPYTTQYKLLKEFNSLYHRTFRRSVEKGTKENSLFGTFGKSVKLGKGGGWKIAGRDEVSKLGNFRTGMVLPRSLFIYPEEYDITCGIEQKADLTEVDFELIIKLIENE